MAGSGRVRCLSLSFAVEVCPGRVQRVSQCATLASVRRGVSILNRLREISYALSCLALASGSRNAHRKKCQQKRHEGMCKWKGAFVDRKGPIARRAALHCALRWACAGKRLRVGAGSVQKSTSWRTSL
ncbi:hypothetical protein TRVL_03411 [Trypanosoma vivax]|nr:hypothetical protein TRVL_03411 [Trypanosoma vivax]